MKTAKKQHKVIGKPFPKGKSGNPNGRPRGSLNFETVFNNAIQKIAKNSDINRYMEQLMKIGLKKAKEGDFRFWSAITDRVYGKVKDVKQIDSEKKPVQKMILTFSEEELKSFND
jgi:hypothetical protein